MNNATTLFFLISISIIFVDSVWDLGFVLAQTSDVKNIPDNPHNIIVKYCVQFADSVARGTDVVQDLIAAGMIPNSYYGKTCQDEINSP
jgi:hypothetical protein